MHNANIVGSSPHRITARPRPLSSQRPEPVDGRALRTGTSRDDIGLGKLFQTLETSDCERLILLRRQDRTLVSALRREVVNGRRCEWELIRLSDDLFVRLSNNNACEQSSVFPISGEGLVEFHFRLSGRLSLSSESQSDPAVEVDRGSLLIWRQPIGWDVTGRIDTEERETSVTIYLRPSALRQYLGDSADAIPLDLRQRLFCEGGDLFALRLVLIPRLTQLIHEISSLTVQGPRRLVQAEALVMLVLCEVVGALEQAPHDAMSAYRITDTDVRCLRHAREILMTRYTSPPTIEALAREVGLGTTKLKNGFKALFGSTICQFANDMRMEQARILLRKPDTSIARVAETLGYEYQNSFTAAFRRHFGVLPKDYRRNPLILETASSENSQ